MWKEVVCVACGRIYSHYSKNNLDELKCFYITNGNRCGGKLKYTGKKAEAPDWENFSFVGAAWKVTHDTTLEKD